MTSLSQAGPLRLGIIGAGWPGERHAEGFLAAGEAQIIAISDLVAERRQSFARVYGAARSYEAYQDLLADPEIDAVVVALPNFLHREAVVAALRQGKHVLCEKPPAISLAEAEEMAETAARERRVLAYANRRRFSPSAQALLPRLAANELGEIYHARAVWTRAWGVPKGVGGWFTDPARAGGGALIDIGIHVLDLAWFLMGRPDPVTVSGQVFNKFPGETLTDDSAFALIRFANGSSLHLETSWALAQEAEEMHVNLYGTAGGAKLNDLNLYLYGIGETALVRTTPKLSGGRGSDFITQARDFIRAVRGEAPPRTTADDGVRLMAMLEAIYGSARQGAEVRLAP